MHAFTKALLIGLTLAAITSPSYAQRDRVLIPNEQGQLQVRDSGDYSPAPLPSAMRPPTVASQVEVPVWELSLDDAIRIALQNTEVVRVLSGVGAASSGQTIYSPGIANTRIDSARAFLDPNISVRNNFFRNEAPGFDSTRSIIGGSGRDDYDLSMNLDKNFLNGANAGLAVGANRTREDGAGTLFNPNTRSNVEFSVSQPLLRGRGVDVNSVPIVLAFLDTESSYFRLKSSLQNLVTGVIQGYWDLVQARTELWVVQQQIKQAQVAYEFQQDRLETGSADSGEVAQAAASLANFEANLVATEAAILNRVASLKAILGMPPGSELTIVPITPPLEERLRFDWDALTDLASRRRPDLVELKIILEADRQRILQARNQSRPQLDAVASYRWNGLSGEMPIGGRLRADPGEHTSWGLGVNFSVPFTMRAARANLRQNELLLASDRANLEQGLLRASHSLAATLRTIDQLYEQREAFRIAREAARESLELQAQNFLIGRLTVVELLLAINTWASSVTSEARAITQLNSTLATLEAETGTILESHGVRLYEERFCSLGPLGEISEGRNFPSALRPSENTPRYPMGDQPSENAFDLTVPVDQEQMTEDMRDERREMERMRRLPPEPTPPLNGPRF